MICRQDKFTHYYPKQKHNLAHGILQIFHILDVKLKNKEEKREDRSNTQQLHEYSPVLYLQ